MILFVNIVKTIVLENISMMILVNIVMTLKLTQYCTALVENDSSHWLYNYLTTRGQSLTSDGRLIQD